MATRTDIHRSGAIVPADYSPVLFYSLPSSYEGMAIGACGVNCEAEVSFDRNNKAITHSHRADMTCCVVALRQSGKVFAEHGGTGKCTACGARYTHGEVWRHDATGEHIHVGHICADKYGLLADYSAHELRLERLRHATARMIAAQRKADLRASFLAERPGLSEALTCSHSIVRDIVGRFEQYGSMSDKQVALVMKLAREAAQPKQVETHVSAPTGRTSFRGEVVSVKGVDGAYGFSLKMTVKVQTDSGSWLAWLTVPSSIDQRECKRGSILDITATLTTGRDAHFAFGKRPIASCVFAAL